jgi:nitroreductase
MTKVTPQLLRELVDDARLAPSIHNIQPTRWRLSDDKGVWLVDDTRVRAPCADPEAHDVRLSQGAALEGMSLALNRRGLSIAELTLGKQQLSAQHVALCRLTVGRASAMDPLCDSVTGRMSWRGTFSKSNGDDRGFAMLASSRDDIVCVRDKARIAEIAAWGDEADLSFLRDPHYRRELLDWMRLSRQHPRYRYDGLNREALAMNAIEGAGATLVLGTLFAAIDRAGLARPLVSDRGKTSSAAGLALFVRPKDEDPLVTGRHFYRLWLEIHRAGFAACPISALADHPEINRRLCELAAIGSDTHRLVNVFRVGRPATSQLPARHFRLPVDELIV